MFYSLLIRIKENAESRPSVVLCHMSSAGEPYAAMAAILDSRQRTIPRSQRVLLAGAAVGWTAWKCNFTNYSEPTQACLGTSFI